MVLPVVQKLIITRLMLDHQELIIIDQQRNYFLPPINCNLFADIVNYLQLTFRHVWALGIPVHLEQIV